MKLSCDVIKDLLLLYEDGVCCEESKQLVEEHLKGCSKCSALLKNTCLPAEMQTQEEAALSELEEKIIKKSFRKIKRRWAISLISLLLLLPLGIGVGTMAYHEYRKEGICFSNLDEILLCQKFFRLLQNGNYQEAVEMLDFETKYREIMEVINNLSEDEEMYQWYIDWYYHYYGIPDISQLSIEEFVQGQQLDALEYLEKYTGTIQSVRFEDAYCAPWWTISYRMTEDFPETGIQQSINIYFYIRLGKIYQISTSYSDSTNKSKSICAAFCRDWREDYWQIEENDKKDGSNQ